MQLRGEAVFTTGNFNSQGITWFHYVNTADYAKRFWSMDVMIGAERGTVADIAACPAQYSLGPDALLFRHGWDHYAEPSEPAIRTYNFFPGYYEVPPGGLLDMAVLYMAEQHFDPNGLLLPPWQICVEVTGRYTIPI